MLSTQAMVEGAKCEQLEKVVIGNNEEKFFQVRVQLSPREKEELVDFLKKILMYLHEAHTRPLGWIQTSFVTI